MHWYRTFNVEIFIRANMNSSGTDYVTEDYDNMEITSNNTATSNDTVSEKP